MGGIVFELGRIEEVTENGKQDFSRWLLEILLPAVKPIADDFVVQVKAQAAHESGWCKVRDLIILPVVVEGGFWLVEKALSKSIEV